MRIKEIGMDHIIYGEWDAENDSQFMIYNHPNGIHLIVFTFSGYDYGGGIRYIFEANVKQSQEIDEIITKHIEWPVAKNGFIYYVKGDAKKLKNEIIDYIKSKN